MRKLVESLLLPLGICIVFAIGGMLLRRRWITLIGVVALYTFSTRYVAGLMIRPLEQSYKPMAVAAVPDADAIVILSGSILRGVNAAGVQWGSGANRYFGGIDLAKAGKARIMVISGGLPWSVEGTILQQFAVRSGIPPERIVVTHTVLTTDDEAHAVSKIRDIHSILLVTSAYHMPRAVLLFRARGLQVTPFPTDQRALAKPALTPLGVIPEMAALEDSEASMREYYGLAVYRTVLFFRPRGF